MQPPRPDINMKYYQQISKITEVVDEQLKRIFDDYQENEPETFENRNVEGWSFVQGGNGAGVANAGNHQLLWVI